jgi:hypothetical protein
MPNFIFKALSVGATMTLQMVTQVKVNVQLHAVEIRRKCAVLHQEILYTELEVRIFI